jgi:hypothetical protein
LASKERGDGVKGKTIEKRDADCCRVGRKVSGLAGQAEGSWRASVVI